MEGWLKPSHPFFFCIRRNRRRHCSLRRRYQTTTQNAQCWYHPCTAEKIKNLIETVSIRFYGAAAGARIPDSQIKSLILYQLSYSNMSYTYVSSIYRFLRSRRNCRYRCKSRGHHPTSRTTHRWRRPCPAKYQYFTYIRYIIFKSDDFSVFYHLITSFVIYYPLWI